MYLFCTFMVPVFIFAMTWVVPISGVAENVLDIIGAENGTETVYISGVEDATEILDQTGNVSEEGSVRNANVSEEDEELGGSENLSTVFEPRKKKGQDLLSRILPMLIIPFMIQTAIIPVMLTMLKMMLLKSAFIGKMAILLGLLNFLNRSSNQGGVYTHNVNLEEPHHDHPMHQLMENHYGYSGGEEYGAYVNRKRQLR